MNFDVDALSVIAYLAVNLLLFGIPLALGVAVAFRITRSVSPRLRYIIAVIAFCLAAFYPILTAFGSSSPRSNGGTGLQESLLVTPESSPLDISSPDRSQNRVRGGVGDQFNTLELNIRAAVNSAAKTELGAAFLFFWLIGSVWLIGKEVRGHLILRRQRTKWKSASSWLCREIGWDNSVPLLVDDRTGPGTVGFLWPVVVIPSTLSGTLTPEAVKQITRHELSHAQWRDPLVNTLLRLIRAVLWISPPLWFLERIIRIEREIAADKVAIGEGPAGELGTMTIEYANSLVQMAYRLRAGSSGRGHDVIAIHFGQKSGLEQRVKRLLMPISRPSILRLPLAALIVIIGISSASSLTLSIPYLTNSEIYIPADTAIGPPDSTNRINTAQENLASNFGAPLGFVNIPAPSDDIVPKNARVGLKQQTDRDKNVEGVFSNETGTKEYKFTIGSPERRSRLFVNGNLSSGSARWTLISPTGVKSFGLELESDPDQKATGHGASEDLDTPGEWTVRIETKNARGNFELQWKTS
jgi:beta-lactamase regulating signal transducer with metallopeptidase domain